MGKTKINEIKKCVQCPHCIILPDPDPYDWFCDDDVKLFCEKLKRTVAAALTPMVNTTIRQRNTTRVHSGS